MLGVEGGGTWSIWRSRLQPQLSWMALQLGPLAGNAEEKAVCPHSATGVGGTDWLATPVSPDSHRP